MGAATVWCYTTDSKKRWEECDVAKDEKCDNEGLNEDFGFWPNRPFYMRSRMPMRRVMRCHGGGWIHLNRWVKNRQDQLFYFDGVSKTIKSQQWKNYAIEKHSNGGHPYMRATSNVNSRWW
jgi:hypothetical protein